MTDSKGITSLIGSKLVIIGGGKFCRVFLRTIEMDNFIDQTPLILGVADKKFHAEGIEYAREKGIYTTDDVQRSLQPQGA